MQGEDGSLKQINAGDAVVVTVSHLWYLSTPILET